MVVDPKRILLEMAGSPTSLSIPAALHALDQGAVVTSSPNGVHPSELASIWTKRRAGPFLSPTEHKTIDALLAELAANGTGRWVLCSIKTEEESFILFVDNNGVGRACINMPIAK